ncbi:MAG TPA: hypothetical protein VL418_04795 [Devosiaceae bacterium]|nr:hypothetical protein [Devosiaceae bacterium]
MQTELYADSIGEITVSGAIVRIDLVSLSATQRDANNKPVPEFRQRVIMSIEGFANSFEVLQKAMHGLIESGAIRRTMADEREGAATPGPSPSHAAPRTNGSGVRLDGASPNFS